ncbi:MAG TPA: aminotransferase class I/II-fold pyridoxal phosphate-dependent enzyme [Terriglobales bacterium]|nr:aminotransferase class I/II-fold pyridoxal phosphate-dependent enzyme [Terriglobales bacterium]
MNLLDFLEAYKETMAPMHMPGHKRNSALAPYLARLAADLDMTEVEGLDNLHGAEGILREGMARTAALWGSKRAFWLVGGSTCGVLAGVYAAVPAGGKVLCARNCHRAVYNGLLLRGADPVFFMPETERETGVYGPVNPVAIEALLDEHPDTKLIILTSPTYEGIVSDVPEICRVAHGRGIPVLVDEAHGAHLGFGHGFPDGAVHAGADIAVQSLHKTLPSLTQTAVLHLNGSLVDEGLVADALAIFETSSPSYLLMSSISGCTELLYERGDELFDAWQGRLTAFYEKTAELKRLSVMRPKWAHDPSKLIVLTGRAGMTGSWLAARLREEYRIETEMAAGSYLVAMTGMGDTGEMMEAFARALLDIDRKAAGGSLAPFPAPVLPKRAISLAEARRGPSAAVLLAEAVGRVCAETVWAYPPGIPLTLPGEVISNEMVELFVRYGKAGVHLKSTSGLAPMYIAVLTEMT